MTRFRLFLCGAVIFATGSTFASAGDDPRGRRPGLRDGDLVPAAALEKLKLNAEQKEKFDKLAQEFQQKHKDLVAKFEAALKDKDRAKYKEATEAQQQLRPDYLKKLSGLLNDVQKKALEDLRPEKPRVRPGAEGARAVAAPGQLLPPPLQERLKLTDEQKKKLGELQKDVDSKIQNLLTEEQRKVLEESKKAAPRRKPQQSSLEMSRIIARTGTLFGR